MFSGIFEAQSKDRIRFAIGESKENHHGLFWIKVGEDGSIYFNRLLKTEKISTYNIPIEGSKTKVKYDELKNAKLQDKDKIKGHKFSFHSSGTVHAFERSFWQNIRNLKEKVTVCDMLFTDIRKLPPMPDKKKYINFVSKYLIEDGYPIACKIIVSSFEKLETFKEIDLKARMETSIILIYKDLKDIEPIAIQIIFYHNKKAPYPPSDIVLWRASKYKTQKEQLNEIKAVRERIKKKRVKKR